MQLAEAAINDARAVLQEAHVQTALQVAALERQHQEELLQSQVHLSQLPTEAIKLLVLPRSLRLRQSHCCLRALPG